MRFPFLPALSGLWRNPMKTVISILPSRRSVTVTTIVPDPRKSREIRDLPPVGNFVKPPPSPELDKTFVASADL